MKFQRITSFWFSSSRMIEPSARWTSPFDGLDLIQFQNCEVAGDAALAARGCGYVFSPGDLAHGDVLVAVAVLDRVDLDLEPADLGERAADRAAVVADRR